MRRIGFKAQVIVVNDALVALVAGAGDAEGVVVVAGTGSIAYGRDASGRAARAGGWGYLLGDEGGGFWIGRAALMAVVRQFDGRGPVTLLTPMILEHLELSDAQRAHTRDLLPGRPPPHDRRHRRPRAAGDGRARCDRRGNPDARGRGARIGCRFGHRRLEMRGDAFPTVLAGGIFRGIPWLVDDVTRAAVGDCAADAGSSGSTSSRRIGAVRLALAAAHGSFTLPI